MVTALFIGRFQPLHLGHKSAIEHILGEVDKLVLGIGSAQYNNTLDNPFTVEERKEMIEMVFSSSSDRIVIVTVSDIHNEPKWVEHVLSSVPSFDVVYTSSSIERELFSEAGYNVVEIPYFERDVYSGTRIRNLIANEGSWKELVPPEAVKIIEKIGGVDRVKTLMD
ncbi:MAG: nicotinamide-nucleotide adenylyltransferase [Methanobacteriota archaeon]